MTRAPLQTSTAFLSTRLSIAWLPDPPSEPTDTLVLTGTSYYVDLRILKEDGSLDWGMAGVKEIVGGTKDKPIARFTNILDSHLPSSSSSSLTASSVDPSSSSNDSPPLPDEGTFSLLPNGNTHEAGTMINPATLLPQLYEEEWAPVHVERGADVLILQSISSSLGRAFVGVCGEWALGIYETKEGGCGGWKGKKKEGGEWESVWSLGEEKVGWVGGEVKKWATTSSNWREGDEVDWAGRSWKVLEHTLFGEGRPK